MLFGAVAAGFVAAALFAAQAWWLSGVVDRVFLQGQTLRDVWPLLALMAAMSLFRAASIWLGDGLAQHAASRIKGALRQQLTGHIFALGPAYTRGERSGELVNVLVEGVETLDATGHPSICPPAIWPPSCRVFVFLLILVLDPWTTLVLLFAGPMLILLLALIGGQAKKITERRFLELSWMSAFFLDVLQGLTTLKLFGRSKEQAETIEEISRHYGKTTMAVLATAFQSFPGDGVGGDGGDGHGGPGDQLAFDAGRPAISGGPDLAAADAGVLPAAAPVRPQIPRRRHGESCRPAHLCHPGHAACPTKLAAAQAMGLNKFDASVSALPQSASVDLSFQPGINSKAELMPRFLRRPIR